MAKVTRIRSGEHLLGNILADVLKRRFGLDACGKCLKWIGKLNENGPDWCVENIELVVDRFEEAHSERKIMIPFSRFVARRIIHHSIRKARKLSLATAPKPNQRRNDKHESN